MHSGGRGEVVIKTSAISARSNSIPIPLLSFFHDFSLENRIEEIRNYINKGRKEVGDTRYVVNLA